MSQESKEKECLGQINTQKIKDGDCNSCSPEERSRCFWSKYGE